MKFDKVVYIRYFPLTKAIYTDLYFEQLLENNVKVEYLDLTSLFFPAQNFNDSFQFNGNIKINNYKELKRYFKLQNNDRVLYISIMTLEWRVLKLFRLITKLNLTIGVFARGVFPKAELSKTSRLIHYNRVINLKRIVSFLKNKTLRVFKIKGYIKNYDYVFKAGDFGYWGIGVGNDFDLNYANIIEVNTVDYDDFLREKDEENNNNNNQIVFLDQYLPYHPDVAFLKMKTVEPEKYYNELNSFFERLENQTGKNVVIAAHPKAEKYHQFNPFNGREIYFNKSNELVKGSFFVLTHDSTSVCYPICYKKRIVLLDSSYLLEVFPDMCLTISGIMNSAGATKINMDDTGCLVIPEKINLEIYNEYKFKYLTSKISEKTISEIIFLNFILGNNK